MEKDKKWRLEYHARRKAALPVLDHLDIFGECHHTANRKRVGGASPLEGFSCVENGECGEQTGAIPTIHRWRRGGGGQCEHPRPMEGC